MLVDARYKLSQRVKDKLYAREPKFGFNGLGETVFYRTYSRNKPDGSKESWADCVIRVVEGVASIRQDWMEKHRLPLSPLVDTFFDSMMEQLADFIFDMKILPPGRGLWMMGTDYVYERGSMALANCGFIEISKSGTDIANDFAWAMDALMCGVGVGFGIGKKPRMSPVSQEARACRPEQPFIIPDSREGWVESVRRLIRSWFYPCIPQFDYSLIRPAGTPINGFGGTASGPEPLMLLHAQINKAFLEFNAGKYGMTRLLADIANFIGCCVVAGNVRRSAEILIGDPDDQEFMELKDYAKHPEREAWGWVSNNTCRFMSEDFDRGYLEEIAESVVVRGEPGFMNQVAVRDFGRFGDGNKFGQDLATGFNPCGEIPLESRELCNLVELILPRIAHGAEFMKACTLATFYASTVSLLPTHDTQTNAVIARNRRIGVSMTGIAEKLSSISLAELTDWCREGYDAIRENNEVFAKAAGVAPSIRVTTVKPSGTVSLLPGVTAGIHFPTFRYAIRRVRVAENHELVPVLREAGYHMEKDKFSAGTLVVEFPIKQEEAREATEVSVWEQAGLLTMLQREWADNAVSVTLYFDPKTEAHQLERVFAQIAPQVKSFSALPHTDEGAYEQAPYSRTTKEKYEALTASLKPIHWEKYRAAPEGEKYCDGDKCYAPPKARAGA